MVGSTLLQVIVVHDCYDCNAQDATLRDVQGTLFWTSSDWRKYSPRQKMLLRFFRDPFVYFFLTSMLITFGQGLHYGFFPHWYLPLTTASSRLQDRVFRRIGYAALCLLPALVVALWGQLLPWLLSVLDYCHYCSI
jgi:uncharacterized protein YjeT (DUF2065 family)